VQSRTKPEKKRLDVLLVERGLAESRQKGQAIILAGQVLINGQKLTKAGAAVAADARVEILGEAMPYVSRGGLKLEGALKDFKVEVTGKLCLDVGSSTGGFTDCLLQRGAPRVYAVDVNVAQLAWKLQQDARVLRVERNARYLTPADVPGPINLATVDVSFISATKVLPAVVPVLSPGGEILILVKPQFELRPQDVGKGGIVRDSRLHQKAIDQVTVAAQEAGLEVLGYVPSRVAGAEGNVEFFLHAKRKALG
jgi:23S rRNA (cytidine1920-2'-O)/16S rRNA (cytidine1409-2'-O)-methyltransferase